MTPHLNAEAHEEYSLILFGSYAKGLAHKESDVDLYLETKSQKVKEEISRLDSKLSVKIGVFNTNALLGQEIIKDHIIITRFIVSNNINPT